MSAPILGSGCTACATCVAPKASTAGREDDDVLLSRAVEAALVVAVRAPEHRFPRAIDVGRRPGPSGGPIAMFRPGPTVLKGLRDGHGGQIESIWRRHPRYG